MFFCFYLEAIRRVRTFLHFNKQQVSSLLLNHCCCSFSLQRKMRSRGREVRRHHYTVLSLFVTAEHEVCGYAVISDRELTI